MPDSASVIELAAGACDAAGAGDTGGGAAGAGGADDLAPHAGPIASMTQSTIERRMIRTVANGDRARACDSRATGRAGLSSRGAVRTSHSAIGRGGAQSYRARPVDQRPVAVRRPARRRRAGVA